MQWRYVVERDEHKPDAKLVAKLFGRCPTASPKKCPWISGGHHFSDRRIELLGVSRKKAAFLFTRTYLAVVRHNSGNIYLPDCLINGASVHIGLSLASK
jgi:hypothetical protein